MGLDTTHNAWHGAYSAFMTWREKIAQVAGLPPLRLMEGFYSPLDSPEFPTLYPGVLNGEKSFQIKNIDRQLPIKWECLKEDSALYELLSH